MRTYNLFLNKLDHLKFRYTLWRYVKPAGTVVNIGCGGKKQDYVNARKVIGIDPVYPKSIEHLDEFIIGTWGSERVLLEKMFPDTVILVDVVEHLDHEIALKLLDHTKWCVKKQIVLFTPYGFLEQNDTENYWNTHRSAWYPQDFGKGWQVFVFPHFHWCDFKGNEYPEPKGAILAIYTKPR